MAAKTKRPGWVKKNKSSIKSKTTLAQRLIYEENVYRIMARFAASTIDNDIINKLKGVHKDE